MSRPRSPGTGSGAARTSSPTQPRRVTSRQRAAFASGGPGRNRWRDFNTRRDRSPNFRAKRAYRRVGKYRVDDETIVGEGAYSVVRPAYDAFGREYVAKIVRKADLHQSGPDGLDEVTREVKVLRHLPRNRNIVEFIELLSEPGEYFVILESVSHGDLCDAILDSPDHHVPEARARRFFLMMTDALLCCHHHGVSHRDVKPENMLLNAQDELKLSDFGLARIHDTPYRCSGVGDMSRELRGTLRYAAPELFEAHFDSSPYDDFVADVWSLGVCLYVMLTGVFPYSTGPDMDERATRELLSSVDTEWPADCSPEAVELLQAMLQKDPQRRIDLRQVPRQPWLANHQPHTAQQQRRQDALLASQEQVPATAAEEARAVLRQKDSDLQEQQSYILHLQRRVAQVQEKLAEQTKHNTTASARLAAARAAEATEEGRAMRDEVERLTKARGDLLFRNSQIESALQAPPQGTPPPRSRMVTASPGQPRRPRDGPDVPRNSPSPGPPKVRSLSPRPGGRLPVRAHLQELPGRAGGPSNSPSGGMRLPARPAASRTATPPRAPLSAASRTTTPPRPAPAASRTSTPPRPAVLRRGSPVARSPGPAPAGAPTRAAGSSPGRPLARPQGGSRTPSSSVGSVRRGAPPPRAAAASGRSSLRLGDFVEYRRDQEGVHVEGVVRYIGPTGSGGLEMVGVEVLRSLGRTQPKTHDGRGCFTPERQGAAIFCLPSTVRSCPAAGDSGVMSPVHTAASGTE
eukprot:TRINITY_DN135_c0_g3_i1.p1 TRINITY_DN135_c0_g3~~TRINITY_DN135_c0_g3_i1.p1  ORF type:complete len:766 (+),score=210.68 TRINITY_DN135_c0_g3_i1:65-2299(+)